MLRPRRTKQVEVAKRLGLAVIGTVGCLLKAKNAGIVAAIMPLIIKYAGN